VSKNQLNEFEKRYLIRSVEILFISRFNGAIQNVEVNFIIVLVFFAKKQIYVEKLFFST